MLDHLGCPGCKKLLGMSTIGVAATHESKDLHACGSGRDDAGDTVFNDDTTAWADATLARCVEEDIGGGLASGNLARREYVGLEM